QYFNPLNSTKYYQNLHHHLLPLITPQIPSIPQLKKPTHKQHKNHTPFKNHTPHHITTNNHPHSKDYHNKNKIHPTLLSLTIPIIPIFLPLTPLYIFTTK
ncbi:SdrH family protein, partial [Staphylococcus epidermidis]|uniref:SdrH family protein n=1 Tax=Staphylococcus epidermidis TaxID=1282 RepID=UPI001C92C1FA